MDADAGHRAGHCDPACQHRPAHAFRLVLVCLCRGGVAGLYSFNYMLPAAGVRGTAITRTAGRYFERLVSHDATFRVLQHLRIYTFSKLLPLSPAGLARFRQGNCSTVWLRMSTLDHLYLRVISPIVGAFVVIVVVTLGLSVLDVPVALTLGGIMLLTLIILPPLFYRAGKSTGENLTRLRGEYRQQLTSVTGAGRTDDIWRQRALPCANGEYRTELA